MLPISDDVFFAIIKDLEEAGWYVEFNDRRNWQQSSDFKATFGNPDAENYVLKLHQTKSVIVRENIDQYPYDINLAAEPWIFVFTLLRRHGILGHNLPIDS